MDKNEIYEKDQFSIARHLVYSEMTGTEDMSPIDRMYDQFSFKYGKRFEIIRNNMYWTQKSRERFDRLINSYVKKTLNEKNKEYFSQYKAMSSTVLPISFIKKPKWAKDDVLYIFNNEDVDKVIEKMNE